MNSRIPRNILIIFPKEAVNVIASTKSVLLVLAYIIRPGAVEYRDH